MSRKSKSPVAELSTQDTAVSETPTPVFAPRVSETPAEGNPTPGFVTLPGEALFAPPVAPPVQAPAGPGVLSVGGYTTAPPAGPARTASRAPMLPGGGTQTQYTLLGHSACAVIRWLGAERYTPSQIKRALKAHGVVVSEFTVKTQYQHGRHGRHGLPALAGADAAGLRAAALGV